MRGSNVLLALTALTVALAGAAHADNVAVGILSFDVLIPGDTTTPGVDAFDISNLTGDPTLGGFALPPDFPTLASLTFLNSTLTLSNGASSQIVNLGDIAPGVFSDLSLQFVDGTPFTSAIFSATLSATSLNISGAAQDFVADSANLTATLLPTAGTGLTAGVDLVVLNVSGSFPPPPTVPEPSTAEPILAVGMLAVWLLNKRAHS